MFKCCLVKSELSYMKNIWCPGVCLFQTAGRHCFQALITLPPWSATGLAFSSWRNDLLIVWIYFQNHILSNQVSKRLFFQVKDATRGVQWAAVPGAECLLLSNAGIFLRTAKSLTNSYGVAIIEDVHPGYYQVNEKIMLIFIHNCLYMLKAQKSNVRQRVASLSVLHRMFGTVVSPLYQFSKSWPISDQNTSFLNPTFRRGPKNLSPYFQSWWFVYQRK